MPTSMFLVRLLGPLPLPGVGDGHELRRQGDRQKTNVSGDGIVAAILGLVLCYFGYLARG